MAKRAPADEEPYRPLLDPGVISAALTKSPPPVTQILEQQTASANKVVEIVRPEATRLEAQEKRVVERRDPPVEALVEKGLSVEDLVEKFDQEKRMLLTPSESAALDRLVRSLATRLHTQVKLSHVLRSLVSLVLNAESEIDKRAGESAHLTRPANGDAKALQRFEREIAKVLAAGLRDAGPLR
jgi:hypothetical protein